MPLWEAGFPTDVTLPQVQVVVRLRIRARGLSEVVPVDGRGAARLPAGRPNLVGVRFRRRERGEDCVEAAGGLLGDRAQGVEFGEGDHRARVEGLYDRALAVAAEDDVAGQLEAVAAVGLQRAAGEGRSPSMT